jgi:plasmid stabilization system protein ParE
MPQGDKSAYTDKQKRKAEHIEEGYEDRGVPEKEAEARAWATVNKESGGGKKSGSGRGKETMPRLKRAVAKVVPRRHRGPRKSVLLRRRRRPRPGNATSITLTIDFVTAS